MNPNAHIEVSLTHPRSGKTLRAAIQVEATVFHDSFAPLPRNREIPFEIQEQEQAVLQKKNRERVASALAKQLAAKIIELAEREDPQFGFSPEEWMHMHAESQQ